MASNDDKPPEPWANGDEAIVFVYDDFERDFGELKEKSRIKIETTLKNRYCKFGPKGLNSERWNRDEGRHKVGHRDLLVQAVKDHQARVYGVEGNCEGKRAFFVSAVEIKKKDKANPATLKRAAEGAVELASRIPGATV